jgi:hypothetical protein
MHDDLRDRPVMPDERATVHLVEQRVEMALRSVLVAEAPSDLSARLLALAAPAPQWSRLDRAVQHAVVLQVPPDLQRRLVALAVGQPVVAPARSRSVWAAYGVAALLFGVVLVFVAQMYGTALAQLGVPELWADLVRTPQQWLAQLYTRYPQSRYVVDAFVMLQSALQWVLVGLIMWMVLELRTPQRREAKVRWN